MGKQAGGTRGSRAGSIGGGNLYSADLRVPTSGNDEASIQRVREHLDLMSQAVNDYAASSGMKLGWDGYIRQKFGTDRGVSQVGIWGDVSSKGMGYRVEVFTRNVDGQNAYNKQINEIGRRLNSTVYPTLKDAVNDFKKSQKEIHSLYANAKIEKKREEARYIREALKRKG